MQCLHVHIICVTGFIIILIITGNSFLLSIYLMTDTSAIQWRFFSSVFTYLQPLKSVLQYSHKLTNINNLGSIDLRTSGCYRVNREKLIAYAHMVDPLHTMYIAKWNSVMKLHLNSICDGWTQGCCIGYARRNRPFQCSIAFSIRFSTQQNTLSSVIFTNLPFK